MSSRIGNHAVFRDDGVSFEAHLGTAQYAGRAKGYPGLFPHVANAHARYAPFQ
jgi:hypothetical protein